MQAEVLDPAWENPVRKLLREGKPAIGLTLTIPSAEIAAQAASFGFDFLWIEMEHSPITLESLRNMVLATRGSKAVPFARVPVNEVWTAKRVLDSGVLGVMFPFTSTPDLARQAATACKYPPHGRRGSGAGFAKLRWPTSENYYDFADRNVMVITVVEEARALKQIDAIAATPGVDVIFVGTSDLSFSMGYRGQHDHPKVLEALEKVVAAGRAHNKILGMPVSGPDQAKKFMEQGFQFFQMTTELGLMAYAARKFLEPLGKYVLEPTGKALYSAGRHFELACSAGFEANTWRTFGSDQSCLQRPALYEERATTINCALMGERMASFLVTGGAGFIGSALVGRLLELGHSVRVVDNFSTGFIRNLADCLDRIDLVEGDLTEMGVCRASVEGIEYVLHQAALPSVQRSVEDPVASHRTNVGGTLNMLVAARDARVKRFVFASSSSVYGNSETLPKVETMPEKPLSPYAISKLSAEKYAAVFQQVYGLETVSLRYFNVFGPRQDPHSPYSAVITRFVEAALLGTRAVVCGDGEQSRDFTYVDDVVEANLLACQADGVGGMVFNISAGQRHTLHDLLCSLSSIVGRELQPEYATARVGDVRHSQAGIDKARRLLKFEPKVSFQDGLERTVDWFRKNMKP